MSSIKAHTFSSLSPAQPPSSFEQFSSLPDELQCMVLDQLALCNKDSNEQRSILNVRCASSHLRRIAVISTRHMFAQIYARINRVISSHLPSHPTDAVSLRFTRLKNSYDTYQTTLPDITLLTKNSPLPSHKKQREEVLDQLILSLASMPEAFEHFKAISTDNKKQPLYPSPMFPNKEAYDNIISVIECMALLETISSIPDLTSNEQILKYNTWLDHLEIHCSNNLSVPQQRMERAKILSRVLAKKCSEFLEIGNLVVPTLFAQYAHRTMNMFIGLTYKTKAQYEPLELLVFNSVELLYTIFQNCSHYQAIIDKGLALARVEGNYHQLESCRPFTMLHMGALEDGLSLKDFWISAAIVINEADQLQTGTFQERYTKTLIAAHSETDQEEISNYAIRLLSCRGRLEDALTLITQQTGWIEQIALLLSSKARCQQDVLSLFWHEDIPKDINAIAPNADQAVLEIANKWLSIQRNLHKALHQYVSNLAPSDALSNPLSDIELLDMLTNTHAFYLLNLFTQSHLDLDQIKAVMNNPLLHEFMHIFNNTTMLPVFELLSELDKIHNPQNTSSSN